MALSDRRAKAKRKRGIKVHNKKYKQRQAERKARVKQFKKGTHPQMWRKKRSGGAGSKLGPMGELGDDVIIEVTPRARFDTVKEISKNKVIGMITTMIHRPLSKYMNDKINIWVPSELGKLRDSIESRLKVSTATLKPFTQTQPYRMVIGTPGVPYAAPVNKMPTSWLQHRGSVGRFGVARNDPNARKGWWNLLLVNGRNLAQRVYKDFINNGIVPLIRPLKGVLGIKNVTNFARSLFTVKYK